MHVEDIIDAIRRDQIQISSSRYDLILGSSCPNWPVCGLASPSFREKIAYIEPKRQLLDTDHRSR